MLTQDEAELYDRQIRLWGVNAQSRIRQSKILMLGFNGVASEVAKILTLAGVGSLTIVDDSPLQQSDLYSNLFCRQTDSEKVESQKFRTHAVASKLKRLNPLVKVEIINVPILSVKPEDYKGYDLVTLHSFLSIEDTTKINGICRDCNIKFYTVLDYGFYGFVFSDLGVKFEYTYEDYSSEKKRQAQSGGEKDPISFEENNTEEDGSQNSSDGENDRPKKKRRIHSPGRNSPPKSNNEKKNQVGTLPYVSFDKMMNDESHMFGKQTSPILLISLALFKFISKYGHFPREDQESRKEDCDNLKNLLDSLIKSFNISESILKKLNDSWYDSIFGSLSPICAILGGVAGQDMIRAISQKDIPLYNTFAFDGIAMNGAVEKLGIDANQGQKVQPLVRDLLVIDDDED